MAISAAAAKPKRRRMRMTARRIRKAAKIRLKRKLRLRRLLRRAPSGSRRKPTSLRARSAYRRKAYKRRAVRAKPAAEPELAPLPAGAGINLVGFLRSEIGLGESMRLAARSLSEAGVPFCMIDYKEQVSLGMGDTTWVHKESEQPHYRVNVFHMNADAMPHIHRYFGHSLWHERYNIGVWHWELPEFPMQFVDGFHFVQELWAPSTYIQQVMAKPGRVPVVYIPHGIHVNVDPALGRDYFGLPRDKFLFYVMYDAQSHTQRKNPHGAIQAFASAFKRNDSRVGLVLKVNNRLAREEDFAPVAAMLEGRDNVYLIDRIMRRVEVNSLLQATDCYVSLHRAEGFGLGLAEAMFLGKPVIGTNWSGNTDFMNGDNSCPVQYSLQPLGHDWAAYESHQIWAEPDLEQAAAYMRELANNAQWRQRIAAVGQHTIRTRFSPYAAGRLMRQRLAQLGFA